MTAAASVTRLGIAQPLPPDLASALAATSARMHPLGREVVWFSEVASTNDAAAALADAGAAHGTVVIADAQTAGRGRLGRAWVSPPGGGLYVSVILRPDVEAARLLTIAAGVALADAIQAATGLLVQLKWPNDLYVGRRKLAGILAEAGTSGAGMQHVIIGFGINVLPAAYPPDVASRATALESELGRPVDRGLVLAECLSALAFRYRELTGGLYVSVIDAWRARAGATFGRRVEGQFGSESHGVVENIDPDGALVVRTRAGTVRILSGEVRWL